MAAIKTTSADTAEVIESLAQSGASIDREACLIKGAKIIGFESSNGRSYPADVLRESVALYEGVRVNLDHPDSANAQSRSVRDRFGSFQNVRYVEGKGIFGDLKFNPKHQLSEQVLWAAENDPSSIGFSHVATVKTRAGAGGKLVVEAINRVRHVDLVADPATTKGVFESQEPESDVMDLTKLTLAELKEARADIVTEIATEAAKAHQPQLEELKTLKAEMAKRDLHAVIEAEIVAAGAVTLVTETFRNLLQATESAEARKALLADRVEVASKNFQKPVTTVAESQKPDSKTTFTAADLMR